MQQRTIELEIAAYTKKPFKRAYAYQNEIEILFVVWIQMWGRLKWAGLDVILSSLLFKWWDGTDRTIGILAWVITWWLQFPKRKGKQESAKKKRDSVVGYVCTITTEGYKFLNSVYLFLPKKLFFIWYKLFNCRTKAYS